MINIITAIQSKDNGLGYKNDLLYKLPEDQKFFRDTTTGHVVIMGRKTWESIPEKFRPLPNRENIIITRQNNYNTQDAIIVDSLEEALSYAKKTFPDKEIFIIGGGEIYKQALPIADKIYVTMIDGDKPADVFFPEYTKMFTLETVIKEKGPSFPMGPLYAISVFTRN